MGLFKEFKEFISKGNVLDLAIGILIGGAFGKIIASFVSDILMPPISIVMGANYTDLKLLLKKASTDESAITLNYGSFLQNLIDFLIVAIALFIVIKAINAFNRKKETENKKEPSKNEEVVVLNQILNELRKNPK